MIKITKKCKNPEFNNILKKLIDTEITARINYPSELGYFSITGKLEYHSSKSLYFIKTKDKQTSGVIQFTPNMVLDYKNDTLNVHIKPTKYELDLFYEDKKYGYAGVTHARKVINEIIKLKRECNIIIPSDLFYPCMIFGKLKYNKFDKFYYIQSSNHLLFCRFTSNAIMFTSTIGNISNDYSPEVSILLDDSLLI